MAEEKPKAAVFCCYFCATILTFMKAKPLISKANTFICIRFKCVRLLSVIPVNTKIGGNLIKVTLLTWIVKEKEKSVKIRND